MSFGKRKVLTQQLDDCEKEGKRLKQAQKKNKEKQKSIERELERLDQTKKLLEFLQVAKKGPKDRIYIHDFDFNYDEKLQEWFREVATGEWSVASLGGDIDDQYYYLRGSKEANKLCTCGCSAEFSLGADCVIPWTKGKREVCFRYLEPQKTTFLEKDEEFDESSTSVKCFFWAFSLAEIPQRDKRKEDEDD